MSPAETTSPPAIAGEPAEPRRGAVGLLRLLAKQLSHDRLAMAALVYLVLLAVLLAVGSALFEDAAVKLSLQHRNLPPLSLDQGFQYILGSDSLGRSVAARIVLGGSRTLGVAAVTVLIAMTIGTLVGIVAGYRGGLVDSLVMRVADVSLAFPGILLAVVLLYIFAPNTGTVIAVLVVNRLPVYMRVSRAETLEIRERLFVSAARAIGSRPFRIMRRHVAPLVVPTILTIATLDLAIVMLLESSLSFLGLGVQPPDISWGLMVADGRRYLQAAWWLAFFPGLAIVVTAIAVNLVSNWLRIVLDPVQSALLHREQGEAAPPPGAAA